MPDNSVPKTRVHAMATWDQLVDAVLTIAEDDAWSNGAFSEYDAGRLEQAARLVRERIKAEEARKSLYPTKSGS